jgi:hypothetical protein
MTGPPNAYPATPPRMSIPGTSFWQLRDGVPKGEMQMSRLAAPAKRRLVEKTSEIRVW